MTLKQHQQGGLRPACPSGSLPSKEESWVRWVRGSFHGLGCGWVAWCSGFGKRSLWPCGARMAAGSSNQRSSGLVPFPVALGQGLLMSLLLLPERVP